MAMSLIIFVNALYKHLEEPVTIRKWTMINLLVSMQLTFVHWVVFPPSRVFIGTKFKALNMPRKKFQSPKTHDNIMTVL